MKHGNLTTRTKVLAGSVLLCLGMVAAGAAAATDTFGGGATLPAGAYVGFTFSSGTHSHVLSSNTSGQFAGSDPSGVDSGSLFGAWAASTSNKVSYCQTGSGNGKKIFDNNDGVLPASSSHALTSVGVCDGTTAGFAAPSGVAVDPHFAGSDAPMSQAEYTAFNTGNKQTKYGQPSQFPAVAGTIAIIFNNADVSGRLNLTDAQVCGVLNHTITDWHTLSASLPSKAIKVVYRSDGSGTTFSLANHLTAVCGASGGHHFITDQAFTNVVNAFGTPASFGWTGVSGNGGIITEMNLSTEDGAISYAESANLKAAVANGLAGNIAYATVNSKDPYADFPDTVTATVSTNSVVSSTVNPITGAPILSALTPNIAGTTCINVVNPTTYANVTTRYPIMAISNLIANYQGNGSDLAAVRGLISSAYGVTNPVTGVVTHPGVTTIGTGTGFAFFSPGTAINVNSCINM
jgi:phosphate transport system substrate-binding protein